MRACRHAIRAMPRRRSSMRLRSTKRPTLPTRLMPGNSRPPISSKSWSRSIQITPASRITSSTAMITPSSRCAAPLQPRAVRSSRLRRRMRCTCPRTSSRLSACGTRCSARIVRPMLRHRIHGSRQSAGRRRSRERSWALPFPRFLILLTTTGVASTDRDSTRRSRNTGHSATLPSGLHTLGPFRPLSCRPRSHTADCVRSRQIASTCTMSRERATPSRTLGEPCALTNFIRPPHRRPKAANNASRDGNRGLVRLKHRFDRRSRTAPCRGPVRWLQAGQCPAVGSLSSQSDQPSARSQSPNKPRGKRPSRNACLPQINRQNQLLCE